MKVKLVPQNIEFEISSDKTLLKACTEQGIEIKSICKGVPSCAECRVQIVEGEHNVLPPTKAEIQLIGSSYYLDGRRLSCQIRCFGDIVVDMKEQLERAENQNKKIRGFKSAQPTQSHAVQDTLLLDEKAESKK